MSDITVGQAELAEAMAHVNSGKVYRNISPETEAVIQLLYARHEPQEWGTFRELTVYGRKIDFFAVNLWGSKRHKRVAYEVKVGRADFLHELNNPHKRVPAETIANECYFVAPAGLIKPNEVPEKWGLMEVVGEGQKSLRIKVRSGWRDVDAPDIEVFTSLARRSSDRSYHTPASFWIWEGKEVGWEELKSLIEKETTFKLPFLLERAREEGKEKILASDMLKRWRESCDVLTKEFGWREAAEYDFHVRRGKKAVEALAQIGPLVGLDSFSDIAQAVIEHSTALNDLLQTQGKLTLKEMYAILSQGQGSSLTPKQLKMFNELQSLANQLANELKGDENER